MNGLRAAAAVTVSAWVVACVFAVVAPTRASAQWTAEGPNPFAATDTATATDPATDTDTDSTLRTAPRPIPNYDGRPDAPASFVDGLAWVPRVLFFPVHLVWEYGLRVPIGFLVTQIEKEHFLDLLFDFFTWQDRSGGLVPTFFFDFGFLPSVGLYFFQNDLLFHGNDLRVFGGFWGDQWLHLGLVERIDLDGDRARQENELEAVVDFLKRPDYIYAGEGYDTRIADVQTRYGATIIRGYLRYRHDFWRSSALTLEAGARNQKFADTSFGENESDPDEATPSTVDAVDQGLLPRLPNNFTSGLTTVFQRLGLSIDSRRARPSSGSGVRVAAFGELGYNAESFIEQRWFRYGAQAGVFLDIGANRTLGLSGSVELVDPVGPAAVPFTELVELSQVHSMLTGFLPGMLRGQSFAAVNLEHRYSIWVWLDGTLHVGVGNVFGAQLEDFAFERLRLFWGLGIRTVGERDSSFNFEVAFGTDTFEQGTSISSIRLAVGTVTGF